MANENKDNFEDALFNLNIALLKRIDELFNALAEARINQDLRGCYDITYQIETEIEHILNDKEIEPVNELKEKIYEIIKKYPDIWHPNSRDRQRLEVLKQHYPVLSNLLIQWDRKLRKLMAKKGMLSQEKGEQGLF